ncbi:glycosyltransferase [Costertonia aggregata]|uniref:Glycosyltransferase n=1 Tax=Costertonia aggregata TaxID=343403 RepID=A0A7H9AKJ5_9FLAO|nr:glycosyltransferase [Costertonia aggregata]QLG43844.1 glycosyltransferase [Costertonia aggregata]
MDLYFSFIIPVFNRPEEIKELLESLTEQTYTKPYEVVIIEDGSTKSAKGVVEGFSNTLNVTYLEKENSGPGDSRNYGMRRAKGNYFIVLDSDCILPPHYLETVSRSLSTDYVDCYGGPDAAHTSFSAVQKAINYAMTSFWTTGGIRGSKKSVDKFQPRSFNMGISKKAFTATGGYGNIHPGEDPDLTIRMWNKGFRTKLLSNAFVYHKRRIDWNKFFIQVHKFGMVRPILNKWHPTTAKFTYWFPTLFCFGFLVSTVLVFFGIIWPLLGYAIYFVLLFFDSLFKNKSLVIAFLSLVAVMIQFYGYGYGFLKSAFLVNFSHKQPKEIFPKLFFKTKTV